MVNNLRNSLIYSYFNKSNSTQATSILGLVRFNTSKINKKVLSKQICKL